MPKFVFQEGVSYFQLLGAALVDTGHHRTLAGVFLELSTMGALWVWDGLGAGSLWVGDWVMFGDAPEATGTKPGHSPLLLHHGAPISAEVSA